MRSEDFQQIIQQHGGLRDTPVALDPEVETKDRYGRASKGPNPTPKYRYIFNDGTTLEAITQTNGDYQLTNPGTAENKAGVAAGQIDPTAPKPGTVASQQNADTSAARQQSTQDYQEGLLLARSRQLDAQQRLQEGQQKVQQLDALLKIQAITPAEYTQRLASWKAGVDAGDTARRTAIEQQNAQTNAGQLGVSRGALGVNQQNADTNREQVIQSAASNAVDQTLKLYQQYAKVGPGFGTQFAAGLNTLSRGGGALTFTPDAFMGAPVPDINQIRSQAVTEAIDRLKGGAGQMAPATAAAVSQTAVPRMIAPSVLPPQPGPPPVQPGMSPEELAAKAAALFGQQPAQAVAAPPVPPYTGPTGSIGERNLPY